MVSLLVLSKKWYTGFTAKKTATQVRKEIHGAASRRTIPPQYIFMDPISPDDNKEKADRLGEMNLYQDLRVFEPVYDEEINDFYEKKANYTPGILLPADLAVEDKIFLRYAAKLFDVDIEVHELYIKNDDDPDDKTTGQRRWATRIFLQIRMCPGFTQRLFYFRSGWLD